MEDKTYQFKILPNAEQDLDNAYDYIKNKLKNSKAVTDLMRAFDEAFIKLTKFPYRGSSYKKYKKILVKSYIIFYTVSDDQNIIIVRRILYGRMNIEKQL
jgi:addiction module RelE/StbE family toxin